MTEPIITYANTVEYMNQDTVRDIELSWCTGNPGGHEWESDFCAIEVSQLLDAVMIRKQWRCYDCGMTVAKNPEPNKTIGEWQE